MVTEDMRFYRETHIVQVLQIVTGLPLEQVSMARIGRDLAMVLQQMPANQVLLVGCLI